MASLTLEARLLVPKRNLIRCYVVNQSVREYMKDEFESFMNQARLIYAKEKYWYVTDPSWTPLFLSAGALVMEVGGLMTHGSVVAREYGIPAVVGLEKVTERLTEGQMVRVDVSNGTVEIIDEGDSSD